MGGDQITQRIGLKDDLEQIIANEGVTRCVMAYSDVSHEYVMHLASRVISAVAFWYAGALTGK